MSIAPKCTCGKTSGFYCVGGEGCHNILSLATVGDHDYSGEIKELHSIVENLKREHQLEIEGHEKSFKIYKAAAEKEIERLKELIKEQWHNSNRHHLKWASQFPSQGLREEDEELLIELERRYASKLMFRGDPAFHHEKFVITDASNGAELKS